jgi:hypothetical protein
MLAHERSEGNQKDVVCSCDVLAQYLREAVDRARFGSVSLFAKQRFSSPTMLSDQSPVATTCMCSHQPQMISMIMRVDALN